MPVEGSKKAYEIPRGELLAHAMTYVAECVGKTNDDGSHGEAYWTAFTAEDATACGGGTVQQGFLGYISSRYDGKSDDDSWDNTKAKPLTLTSLKSRTTRCVKLMMEQFEAKVKDQGDDISVAHLKHWITNPPKPEKKEEIVFHWDDLTSQAKALGLVGWETIDGGELK